VINKLKNRIARCGGLAGTAVYYARRASDELYVRRFGLRRPLSLTLPRYSPKQIGFKDTTENHVHIATGRHALGLFRQAMDKYVKPTRDDVLLDYGSGLGGALLLAATYPFNRIIGVEYSEELSAQSRDLIAMAQRRARCTKVDLVVGDVRTYRIPDDVTVIYFFAAFSGSVLDDALKMVRQSLRRAPRKIRFVCLNPEEFDRQVKHQHPWITLRHAATSPDGGYPMFVYTASWL
jgi:SAM-dependent methyltransferase